MARIKVWNGSSWDYVGNDITNLVTEGGAQILTNKTINASQLVDDSIATAKLEDEAVTAAKLDGPEAWIAMSYQNGWVSYDAETSYGGGWYYKDVAGTVHLRGLVKSGTDGSVIANLPAGYRPIKRMIFAVMSNNIGGRLDITESGDIAPNAGTTSPTWVSLSGISFRGDQ